ncbi:hypothetical protein IQ266_04105 [filamentous cyanobacterium LEGE 11480]|uniref:DUF4189 domain-containing protein n=1 Tax=Romeriopsis navalis LEGE 11480 TaxID=2777977 RepID=A0A928VLY5_9CYAN|nr:hypothetical protein [Romeriopsis navalis]MBE9028945.1 hypothetical protein [Romeriopsis navalis LEGE 11480]
MRGVSWFTTVSTSLLLTATLGLTANLPGYAQADNPEARCYANALSFGATRSAKRRATYLCQDATSIAPAKCYWKALGFGPTRAAKRRAAYLCQGVTSTDPAQCYWNALSFGATNYDKRQAVIDCKPEESIVISPALENCVKTYQTKFQVSPDTALQTCTEQQH